MKSVGFIEVIETLVTTEVVAVGRGIRRRICFEDVEVYTSEGNIIP